MSPRGVLWLAQQLAQWVGGMPKALSVHVMSCHSCVPLGAGRAVRLALQGGAFGSDLGTRARAPRLSLDCVIHDHKIWGCS